MRYSILWYFLAASCECYDAQRSAVLSTKLFHGESKCVYQMLDVRGIAILNIAAVSDTEEQNANTVSITVR